MPQWFVFQMKNFSALSKKVQSSGKDLLFLNFYHPCTFPMLCQRCRISHSGGRSPDFFTFLAFLPISRSSTVFSRLFRKCWVHHKIPMYMYMYTIVGLLRGMGCRRTHMYIMHAVEREDWKCYKGRFTIPKTQRPTTDDSPATCRGAVAGCRWWSPRPKRRSWARLNFCDQRLCRRPGFHRNVVL